MIERFSSATFRYMLTFCLMLTFINWDAKGASEEFVPKGKQQEIYLPSLLFSGPNQVDSLGRKNGLWAYYDGGHYTIETYSEGKKNGLSIESAKPRGSTYFMQLLCTLITYNNDTLKSYMVCPKSTSPLAEVIYPEFKRNTDFMEEAKIIGYANPDSVIQLLSYGFGQDYRVERSGWTLYYLGETWEIDGVDVGPQVYYNSDGSQTVKIPEILPRNSMYDDDVEDTTYRQPESRDTTFYKYPFIFDQYPLFFKGPNQRDSIGQKIGQWVEVVDDNSLEISFYENGKRFGYRQTYVNPRYGSPYLAIISEMKDDKVAGNAIVFNPQTRIPYIVAKDISRNTDFKEEADLLIGFGDTNKTVQSYIYIYEDDRLVCEGWMICLESDFLKRRCYFVGDLTVYDEKGKASIVKAPMDGTKIQQFNLPRKMDVAFPQ